MNLPWGLLDEILSHLPCPGRRGIVFGSNTTGLGAFRWRNVGLVDSGEVSPYVDTRVSVQSVTSDSKSGSPKVHAKVPGG